MAFLKSVSPAPVIHWFRRDLRLNDNTALGHAIMAGLRIVPVYVATRWSGDHAWTGWKRQRFLCGSLASLADRIAGAGGRMVFRRGEAVEELLAVARKTGAAAVFFNEDPDPFGKEVEWRLRARCAEEGIDCRSFHDVSLHGPDEVLTGAGTPYRVFTPYFRRWSDLGKAAPLSEARPVFAEASACAPLSLACPTLAEWGLAVPPGDFELPEGGEPAAARRLTRAMERWAKYAETRDFPAAEGTSRLSQDLRFGLLSVRTIHAAAMQARAIADAAAQRGIDTFIKELAWREFYMAILHHYPSVLAEEFQKEWRGLPWDEPGARLEAWKTGRTGFPIVDAGMRELWHTGFMHNRVRMIVAMFLTKDLHLDWRWGESWFMQHLIDGEIASNNGGWQWSAGTGADAAPYFRIQNPWSQSKRYDPDGSYIRQWLPELREVPASTLHRPPGGSPLAPDYPLPIVDHDRERLRTLAVFKAHRAARPR